MEYLQRPRRGKPSATARPVPLTSGEITGERAHATLERALEPGYHRSQGVQADAGTPGRPRRQMPRGLVVLVMILGLLAGASVAGVMFYDRVALLVVERIHLK
jgi:hypothetical protein